METAAAAIVALRYRQSHDRILRLLDDLTEMQLTWHPPGGVHAIGWIVWHLARWADHLQAHLCESTPELLQRLGPGQQTWVTEGLAARWGLDPAALGADETGMLMGDDAAASLALPGKAILIDYARRAFALAERSVDAVDDRQFVALRGPAEQPTTVGDTVLAHLVHDNRHLGEIECLRGLQGLVGTATQ
jgi:hypothetical protein